MSGRDVPPRQPKRPSEKLQKGGPKAVRRAADTTPTSEKIKHLPTWWKKRHAAKKKRLAAMSRKKRVARRFAIVGTWLLGLFALFMVTAVALFYTLSNVPRPEDLQLQQAAVVLYSDGSVMARIGNQNRTIVRLDQVPQNVRWAVLAAEDRGFYSEPGFSITGTMRAALSDLTGGDTQGGSGIAQQYAKNAYLNDSRSVTRKLKELMIAVKLSRQYSKDQILEFYLNTVYFGRGAYGIEAAAQTYFNADVSKLTTAQGAVLAASLRAPSYYDPAENLTAAQARWQYVLDGMVSTGHLTKAQEAALKYPTAAKPRSSALGVSGPLFAIVQQVRAELQANGIDQTEVDTRGLRIQTTIDKNAQAAAASAINQVFATLTPQQRNMKKALVAVNPATGGVLAYYGNPTAGGFDYATQGLRPPGSSFKPYTLATVLTQTLSNEPGHPKLAISSYVDGSQCTTIQGRRICNDPTDIGYSSGSITIANAMKHSLNTTFDELAVEAGPNSVADMAHAAGVAKTVDGKATLADASGDTGFGIGIGDYPVRPIDQAVGFATFANGGVRNGAYFVQQATDSNGHVVYRHKAAPTQGMDPKVANDVTLSLEPVAGVSGDALAGGRISAAKTGTEGIEQGPAKGHNSDAWMVGYTPQVSAAIWVGSGNSNQAIYNAFGGDEYGRDMPGRTWQLFMDTYLTGKPNLPMATQQMITGGDNLAATPTPTKSKTPTPTTSPSKSKTPTPSTPPPTTSPSPSPSVSCTPKPLKTCPP